MLVNLHAHLAHPDFYNQHPYWGPFRDDTDGLVAMRIGKWTLTLSTREIIAKVKSGEKENLVLPDGAAQSGSDLLLAAVRLESEEWIGGSKTAVSNVVKASAVPVIRA